jgi:hypothetical protein
LTLLRIATGIFTQEFLFAALRIFGFAALGPTKGSFLYGCGTEHPIDVMVLGSAAAWLQAWLFGPAVPKGSWFSVLQRIPMARAKL